MTRWTAMAAMFAVGMGCSGRSPSEPRATLVTEVHSAPGYTSNVIPGSRTVLTEEVLEIDAPDGFRWMEARWVAEPVGVPVTAWGVRQCDGLIWNRDANPVPNVRTRTGMCTREFQQYWTFLSLETRPEGILMTTWLAHRESLAYEDAWVEYVGTALSLTGADTPLQAISEPDLRRLLRQTSITSTGSSPVPGGGELGAAVSEKLTALWTARLAAPGPQWTVPPAPSPTPSSQPVPE